jgi:hypothetical protein
MARCHREQLLREAALVRVARGDDRRRVQPLRRRIGRAVCAVGKACLLLGDALAGSAN